jgi:hypothetical protein
MGIQVRKTIAFFAGTLCAMAVRSGGWESEWVVGGRWWNFQVHVKFKYIKLKHSVRPRAHNTQNNDATMNKFDTRSTLLLTGNLSISSS